MFQILFRIEAICPKTLSFLPDKGWRLTLGGAMIIITAFGATQNTMFISLLCAKRIKRTQTHKIYGLLALIDTIFSLTVGPIHSLQALNPTLLQDCALDAIRVQLAAATGSMSSYCVCLLAYDRYRMIAKPYNSDIESTKLYIVFILLAIMAIVIPAIRLIPHTLALRIYSSFVLFNGISIIIMLCISYYILIKVLRRHSFDLPRKQRERNMKSEKEVTKIAVIIISIHITMLSPCLVYHVFTYIDHSHKDTASMIYVIAIVAMSLNTTINPILYYFANEHVRDQFLVMVHWHSNNSNHHYINQITMSRARNIRRPFPAPPHLQQPTITDITPLDIEELSDTPFNDDTYRPITFY